jgi:hypothetical protein
LEKNFLIGLLLVILISTVNAFPINTNSTVDVYENGLFYVEITNNTSELQDLEINFYTPAEIKINAPSKIAPNTNITAQVTVYNKYDSYREITSKLEVTMGQEIETKNINLRFFETDGTMTNELTSFFGAGYFVFGNDFAFSLIDWIAFWVLVIVAAILLIALVARIVHRV